MALPNDYLQTNKIIKTMNERVKRIIRELNTNRLCFVPNELRDDFEKTIHERGLIVFGGMMTKTGQYAYIE